MLGVAVLTASACLAVPSIQNAILKQLGSALIFNDPVTTTDLLVVSVDAEVAGLLEAADLVHGGVATNVVVFVPPLRLEDLELQRRRIPNEDTVARYSRLLAALGVESSVDIRRVSGTGDEARVLRDICLERGFRSAVVITTPDHSRRLSRTLGRSMKGHGIVARVHATRYSDFQPERWWQTRDGVRTELVELEKLLLDFVLHPF